MPTTTVVQPAAPAGYGQHPHAISVNVPYPSAFGGLPQGGRAAHSLQVRGQPPLPGVGAQNGEHDVQDPQ